MRTSVRLTYGEDLQIDWDGHGELLLKVVFLSVSFISAFLPLLSSHPNTYKDFLV